MTAVVYLLMRQPKAPTTAEPEDTDGPADKGDA